MANIKEKLTPRCSRTGAVLYFAIAAAAVLLDRWSKNATVASIPLYGKAPAVPGVFRFTYVQNTGAAWSMLSNNTDLLAIISAVASVAIALYMLYGLLCPAARLCLAAVIGGAVGNLIDRVRLGYVIDMIETTFIDFPVFNVADCFIVVGGIAFVAVFLFINDKYLIARGLMQPDGKPVIAKKENNDADQS